MKKVLLVKANPQQEKKSYSLRLAKKFIDEYQTQNPNDQIIELDLYKEEIPFIDGDVLSARGKVVLKQELNEIELEKINKINRLADLFLESDKIIFSAPMWNFGFPPMVKAYIDAISIAGKTFKYTENGPVGLAGDKAVVLLEARGGIYSEGSGASSEHTKSYLETVMNFLGVKNFKVVLCEGVNLDHSKVEEIYLEAVNNAKEVARLF
ncbi:FMN-dependent NADH-azoreductase [Bacillus sp. SCS-151]|uniref:FMN-dependent NADH-azoreductase n=1 Tax=Nanhaiella sioensis TaxID=3115293 RepID=UPI00397AB71C